MHRFTAWIEAHKGESIGIAIGLIGLVVVLFLARRGGSGSGAPGQTPAFVFPGGGGGGGSADGGGPGSPGSTASTSQQVGPFTPAPDTSVSQVGNQTVLQAGSGVTSVNNDTGQVIAGFGPNTNTNVLAPFSGVNGSSSRVGAPQSN